MNEMTEIYRQAREIKKTQVRKRESPKSWRLVYIVGGKLVETIKDNSQYSLLAGLMKKIKEAKTHCIGTLKIMPQKG